MKKCEVSFTKFCAVDDSAPTGGRRHTREQSRTRRQSYGGHSQRNRAGGVGASNERRHGSFTSAYVLDDVRTLVSVVFGGELPRLVEKTVSMIEDVVPTELLVAIVLTTQTANIDGGLLPETLDPLLKLLPDDWAISAGASLLAAVPGGKGVLSKIITKMGIELPASTDTTLALFDAGTYALVISLGSGANGAEFSLSLAVSIHASALPDRTDPAVCNVLCELAHDVLGTDGTFRLEGAIGLSATQVSFSIIAAVDGLEIELGAVTLTHVGIEVGASFGTKGPAMRAFITGSFDVEQPPYDGPAYPGLAEGTAVTFDHNLVCPADEVANLGSALSFTGGLGIELKKGGPSLRFQFKMDGFCKDPDGLALPTQNSHRTLPCFFCWQPLL